MNEPTEQYIKAKEFRQWLLKQPDDRTWDYGNIYQCVVCSYLSEACGVRTPHAGGDTYGLALTEPSSPIPDWLTQGLWDVRIQHPFPFGSITARNLKTALNL